MSHPSVVEAIAVPFTHAELGDQVGAAVVLDRAVPTSIDDMREFVTPLLSRIQLPTRWWLRHELLPTSPQGKIAKNDVLAQWVAAGDADLNNLAPTQDKE